MKRHFVLWALMAAVCFYAAPVTEALFSPDDRPKIKLLSLIAAAQQKIYAAVYMFTDKDVAQALVTAKQHGVDVRLVVDATSTDSRYAQVFELQRNNIPVYVFDTKQHHSANARARMFAPLMHNKFALIDGVLWTGSFNWTQSANNRNQENVIVTDDKTIRQKYEQQFMILIQRSRELEGRCLQKRDDVSWYEPWTKIRDWMKGLMTSER